jgi:hypothetical protein
MPLPCTIFLCAAPLLSSSSYHSTVQLAEHLDRRQIQEDHLRKTRVVGCEIFRVLDVELKCAVWTR